MNTKHVLVGAFIFYLILMAAGGAAYYAVQQRAGAENVATASAVGKSDAETEKEKEKADPEAERKKRAEERAKRQEEERKRQKQREDLVSGMKVVTRNGTTYYSHPHDEQTSGIYLRPFIAERDGECVLKNDVLYYSTLEDANYGWVHGDHLEVQADGATVILAFDSTKRRDKLGKGAETVTEHYVVNADEKAVQMLKAVGNAANVTLRFYQEGSYGASHPLGRQDIRRVRNMVALYEMMKAEEVR